MARRNWDKEADKQYENMKSAYKNEWDDDWADLRKRVNR